MRECPICRRCFADDILMCPDESISTSISIPGGPILDGRYKLLRRLGQGSTGVVFKARDIDSSTACAIKVFWPALVDNDPRHHFLYYPVTIRHRNVARIFEFGISSGGLRFLVMEFVRGRSLQDILTEERILPPSLALDFAYAIGMGLRAAHEEGMVHGDLNPSRIMVPQGKPIARGLKILDLGLAPIRWTEGLDFFPTGVSMRSALYKAPEQWSRKEPDARADVYSLGIILYQMLTGDVPFRGRSISSVREQHLKAHVPSFASVGFHVPPQIEALVRHALEKEVTKRTPSIEVFIQELGKIPVSDAAVRAVKRRGYGASKYSKGVVESLARRLRRLVTDESEVSYDSGVRDELKLREKALGHAYYDYFTRVEEPPRPQPLDENVQFTVYRPRAVEPERWYSLFVYAHLSENRPDAPPSTPHPKEEVERKAREALGKTFHAYYDNVADSLHSIPLEGILTFVAAFEGIEFVPDHHRLLWEGPVHELEFKLRARRELEGQTVRGHLRVYLGIILVGEVSLAIRVNTQEARAFGEAPAALDNPVACYRKIFASYSHSDEAIVEQFEQLVEAFGDKYLRDVRDIRAGEKWDERLEELIREADIFQLFWSKNSMRSKFVRDEWEYALTLRKDNFIRPTFWEVPMPEDRALGLPPAALLRLQFKRVPVYGDQPPLAQNMEDDRAVRREATLDASITSAILNNLGTIRSQFWMFAMAVFLALGAIGFLIWYLLK